MMETATPIEKEKDNIVNADEGGNKQNNCDDCQDEQEPKISKRHRKRLAKKEFWEKIKIEKRAKERQKKKEKLKRAKENGEKLGPSRKKLKEKLMKFSNCKIKVAIDCSLDTYMNDKEIVQACHQLQYSYSTNRRAENPVQFYCTSVGGRTEARLEAIGDYKHWDVNMKSESYLDLFGKEKVVYLSSDSDNVLEKLEEDKAYIIGGLVDHNRHKGLCHRLATEQGIAHAQLPIGQFIDMKTRKVLTINQVFDILLYFSECGDWEKAFFKVIPQRKGAKVKSKDEKESDTAQKTENKEDECSMESKKSDSPDSLENSQHTEPVASQTVTDT